MAFKKEFGEIALNALINQAIASVKKNNPSFEEREGKEVLIFHDAEGAPMLNKTNAMPSTAKELLIQEFTNLGILDTKPNGGAGGQGGGASKSLLGAKTQVEADEMIKKQLMADGIAITHKDYATKFNELRTQYKVSELPMN